MCPYVLVGFTGSCKGFICQCVHVAQLKFTYVLVHVRVCVHAYMSFTVHVHVPVPVHVSPYPCLHVHAYVHLSALMDLCPCALGLQFSIVNIQSFFLLSGVKAIEPFFLFRVLCSFDVW